MDSKSHDVNDWHERQVRELRRQREGDTPAGKPESPASRETFPHRTREPGDVGLANEARPGLGTREGEAAPESSASRARRRSRTDDNAKPKATPYGYEEPRPAPREAVGDELTEAQERSTGVSGHTGHV